MARRGRSRARRARRRNAQNKPATISAPSPVRSPAPATVTVRRRVVDPSILSPGRRVSDLPSLSPSRRQTGLPVKPVRDLATPAPAPASVSPRKRLVSVNGKVAAYRSASLDRKPGAASGKLWRDDAAKSASRDDRLDDKRPAECHPRPERVAKPPTAGGGSAPAKFVNWCR